MEHPPTTSESSFGLNDFWFGCGAYTGEAAVALAIECTISVAGFKDTSNQEVALASYTFTPPAVR